VKLVYDQNLSPDLVQDLAHVFPVSFHVIQFEFDSAGDFEVWQFAKVQGKTIVTKDADFVLLSFLHGAPPKVVCIRRADASYHETAQLLRVSREQIETFVNDRRSDILELE
jgi:predicted nuclease of predicted toxin-antitoxin system